MADEKLKNALLRKYVGDGFQEGLVDRDPCLRRAFPDFGTFWQPTTFWRLSRCLYERLLEAAELVDHDQAGELDGAGQPGSAQPANTQVRKGRKPGKTR